MKYKFGIYELNPGIREFRRGGVICDIEPQAFDLLHILIENREKIVTKDELNHLIWHGRFVTDASVNTSIKAARRAIGDSGKKQSYIQTFRGRGFRFIGKIELDNPSKEEANTSVSAKIGDEKTVFSISDKPAIAVLPFDNISQEPDQDYFCDGVTEDIITALSKLHWFLVIARNSTSVYKDQPVDVKRIGNELGVRYILKGSIRKVGSRVRISAQLVDTLSGTHIWAQNYDRELIHIFELQDDITQTVAAAIEPKLVAAEGERTQDRLLQEMNAWELVAQAMTHYGRMTTSETETAIRILRTAIHNYPNYGPANSLLAFTLLVSGHVGWTPESDEYIYAAELAQKAVQLDNEDPWAHLALGYVAFTKRQTEETVREYSRALELNPNFATAYGYMGWALAFDGQSEKAIQYFELALRISPHDPLKAFFYSGTGVAHYMAFRYDEAANWARTAIRERPEFTAGRRMLCAALAQAGRNAEAREEMALLMKLQPNLSIEWIKQHVPYTASVMPHFLEGMKLAGVE